MPKSPTENITRRIRVFRHNSNLAKPVGSDVTDEVFEQIVKKFPRYKTSPSTIYLERPLGHQDLDEFLTFLRSLELKIQKRKADRPMQVTVADLQEFTKAEINSALLVECALTAPQIASGVRFLDNLHGEFKVEVDSRLIKNKNKQFGALWPHSSRLVVREAAKRKLESVGLTGLCFKLLGTTSADGKWPPGIEPLYQIWGELELPPVKILLCDNAGNVFPSEGNRGPFPAGCLLLDGYIQFPQLQYAAHEVERLGSFDVAHTYERIGSNEPCCHQLVYSQKAIKAFREIGMKVTLKPVLICD